MEVGHDDDRDLAGVEPAGAQLGGHVFARLQGRLAEAGGGAAEVLAGVRRDRWVQAGVDEDRVGARVADQEDWDRDLVRAAAGQRAHHPQRFHAAARVDHHLEREVDVAGDHRLDRDAGAGRPADERLGQGGGLDLDCHRRERTPAGSSVALAGDA